MTRATDAKRPVFTGGPNVAMKLPPHRFEQALRFYRDTLGLEVSDHEGGSKLVAFGPIRLWLDPCPQFSQTELWLEVVADDTERATRHLAQAGITRCDAIEPLPEGLRGFWIASPADIVHIVSEQRG